MQVFRGADDASGQDIAAQNAAENIDEDGVDLGIAHQNAKCVFHLIGGSAAANVEKVRRGAAGVLDDVHGSHGQASAVDHAGDAAIELDVVEAVLGGFHFKRIFLVKIAQFAKVFVAEQRVVVEGHFGVESNEFVISREDAWIDFEERRIRIDERAIE